MSNGQYVSLAFAKRVIVSQACDRMAAYDMGRDHQITRAEGKPALICAEVDECYHNVSGVFRVEVWKHRPDANGRERAGGKSVSTAPLVFLLGSRAFADEDGERPEMDGHRGARPERDGDDGEEEEEEEESGPAPMTEFQHKLLEMFAPLATQLLPKLMGIPASAPVNGAQPVAAAPVADAPAPVTGADPGDAKRIAKAIAKMAKADPATFAAMKAQLLSNYGDQEQ